MLYGFYIAIVVVIVLLAFAADNSTIELDKKWTPIDDDEFMRRCPEGTDRDTALKVRRIVSEQLGVDYDRIYPEQNFRRDLDCE